jgi:hypothetical protein
MGLFAFRRLRDQLEAASQEAASFAAEQCQLQEPPATPKRRRQPKPLSDHSEGG